MKKFLTLIALTTVSAAAMAHPGHADTGLMSGLVHPVSGIDHILAMLGVGLWAASLGGKARWALPAGFVAMMAVGFAFGANGGEIPMMEQGIAASVLVIGLAAAWAKRIPVAAAAALVGVFALFHGVAHGVEMHGSSALAYAGGFLVSTVVLLAAGLFAGTALSKNVWFNRIAGTAIGAVGLGLLFA
ncbi:HupE/UreJ family protein [Neisseria perflava]|uniref:HupE/UreJ family protein n=1 Tax=Neisseria perflava TaxID=33053 RepID=UPI00209C715C|nr:HupE/UreJ family protein [Neisseria perflava]MCP1661054.1 urease accessory protein [Neisseria perflava]MCP1772321.1 urease accessory protein [Neisseria perflava]